MRDSDLIARAASLQADAADVLARLDALFEGIGTPIPTGSFVSGLMVWRDLDVMVLGGPDFSPQDVLALLGRAVSMPGVTGFEYLDERGSSNRERLNQRYHVVIRLGEWRIDLSVWMNDDHAHVTAFHGRCGTRLTDDERLVGASGSRTCGTGARSTRTR